MAFADEAREVAVETRPGAYAAAVRYVRETTGQASRLLPLGIVVVGGATG